MLLEDARREVLAVAQAMYKRGLVVGTWGNVSRREGELVAITPSGMDYDTLKPEDIVVINLQGEAVKGRWRPSTEWQLHCLIYERRPLVQAIVHTHSPYAAAFAVAGKSIPAVLEESAQMLGGEVRTTPYVPTGTHALAEAAERALGDCQACLLANHGLVAVGEDCWQALQAAQVTEKTAMIALLASQLGRVNVLSEEEVKNLREGFAHYGQIQ